MEHEIYWPPLTEQEVNMAFNMGLQTAVCVLEKSEELSPEGRKKLLELLKNNIAENERVGTVQL